MEYFAAVIWICGLLSQQKVYSRRADDGDPGIEDQRDQWENCGKEERNGTTKQISETAERTENLSGGCSVVLFTLYVLPQYFGLPFPLFDLTALRIMIVAVLLLMLAEPERIRGFVLLVVEEPCTKVLLPYFMVIGYTMVLRADVNAFLNPFIELLTFYLLIYLIRNTLGVEKRYR